jgi:hypothetical protein
MPDPIPPPPEEEEVDTSDLDALVGRTLLDLDTNFFGIVRRRTDRRTGRLVYWLSDPNSGRAQDLRTGATLVDPNTRAVTNVSTSTTGSAADSIVTSGGKLSEADVRRLFGEEEDGGGGSAPSFASTQAAQTQAEEFERGERIAGQEFSAEENRLAEEAALKRGRLSTLTDLIQSFVASQSQARDTLANLQPDPFRFAAVAGGIAPFGVTPQQGFTEQLQQFASAPAPTADPNASLPSIESAIQGLTGASVPLSPATFGAAEGVVIEMARGADGGYSAAPLPFDVQARLVGENPDGTVNRTTEVMITSSQGTAIIPLGKGAQDGGFFPFQPIPFTRESLLPALTTSGIFQEGQNIPRGRMLPDQSIAGFAGMGGHSRSFLENLGVSPRFISPFGQNEIFFRDPNTPGQFRLVTDRPQLGGSATGQIQPGSVVQVSDLGQFGTLRNERFGIGANELRDQSAMVRDVPPFTRFSAPLFEPTTGTMLPAPFMVASEMNRLRLTNPGAFNLLLSAYESAGMPAMSVLSTIQQALPFGQARSAVGLR